MSADNAWHYTIGRHARTIFAGGLILPATEHVPAGEKPVVWFSTRQDWEPTATKGIITDPSANRDAGAHEMADLIKRGLRRDATMAEMMAEGGVWRFGVPSAELFPWGRLKEVARIRQKTLRGLLSSAERSGADPYDWYGSLEPVAMERCVVECRMTEAEEWHAAMPA